MKKTIDTSGVDTMTDCAYSIIDPKTKEIIQEINEGGFKVKFENGDVEYFQEGTTRRLPQDQVINVVYKQEKEIKPYRYYYQNQIDLLVEVFAKTGKLDQVDDEFVIDFIKDYLPKDLQPSLQNVKPFDLERSIFIARAWQALADKNLII